MSYQMYNVPKQCQTSLKQVSHRVMPGLHFSFINIADGLGNGTKLHLLRRNVLLNDRLLEFCFVRVWVDSRGGFVLLFVYSSILSETSNLISKEHENPVFHDFFKAIIPSYFPLVCSGEIKV